MKIKAAGKVKDTSFDFGANAKPKSGKAKGGKGKGGKFGGGS